MTSFVTYKKMMKYNFKFQKYYTNENIPYKSHIENFDSCQLNKITKEKFVN